MKNQLIILLIILFASTSLLAAAKPTKTDPKAVSTTPAKESEPFSNKRQYTDEEFKAAVSDEAARLMKKAGSAHLVDFSKELLEKEEAIKVRELAIKKDQEQLDMNKEDFKKKLIEFQDSQKKFLGCVDEKNQKADKRITQMVDVISSMKPQNAADVLSIQDPDLSVRILSELDAIKLSKIFNLMDKEVSARLQKQFLQMKK